MLEAESTSIFLSYGIKKLISKNMKRLFLIFVLISICNFSNAQSNYFPLEKGATFTYAYGSELYQGAYDDKRFKVKILNTTKVIDGKEYFISETSSGSGDNYALIATSYMRAGKDGSILTLQDEEEYITVPAVPKIGKTWTTTNGEVTYTTRVADLNGTINTATKTYSNCLVLEQKDQNGMLTRTYSQEGVGMVATTLLKDGSEQIFFYLVNE
jgi:hypothetical protein